jgi:hypothetical protein
VKKILILGVNGFIGHHLSRRIIDTTEWEVFGMDMQTERVSTLLDHERFHFFEGDITINKEWIQYHIRKCDTVLPLVAIATPATYVKEPLRVFELDFEANLPIVRHAVKYGKRVIFPSTSEVYGMSRDSEFDPENSELVYGPINKPRWIYACAKQLMDRVIAAYGQQEGLDYTLFRPFNWIGAGLDSIHTAKEGSSRVITQFFGHIVRGESIKLEEQLFGPRTGNHDDRTRVDLPGIPGGGKAGENDRNHLRSLLRQRLPGRAEPGAQDRQYPQGPGLGAEDRHEDRAPEYLRRLPYPCRGRAQPDGLTLLRPDGSEVTAIRPEKSRRTQSSTGNYDAGHGFSSCTS